MNTMPQTTASDGYGFHQLAMIRGAFLQHLAASQITPEKLLRYAGQYSEITHWEELLCAAIDPDGGRLTALVGVHRPAGYSGLFRRHGSIEYVRFFIDWGDGDGYQPVSLVHFKICDLPSEEQQGKRPRYWRVSTAFDQERYWGCVMSGVQPRVKAVLSWHQVPELDAGYTPLFGNRIESDVCIESDKALMRLAGAYPLDMDGMLGAAAVDSSPGFYS
jgi:hypothetical protein